MYISCLANAMALCMSAFDLMRRVSEHKNKTEPESFTAKYGCDKLAYYEKFKYVNDAIAWEKKLKAGSRAKKIMWIENMNPNWIDLSGQDMFWIGI